MTAISFKSESNPAAIGHALLAKWKQEENSQVVLHRGSKTGQVQCV